VATSISTAHRPPIVPNDLHQATNISPEELALQVIPTSLKDVVILEPKVFGDERGFFLEAYNESTFKTLGLPTRFMQDNHSGSRKGVLRGLHYQLQQPQGKLVRALRGDIFDVAVDVRESSAQFGQWFGLVLSAENKRQLWIPPGFAHGFLVLTDFAEVSYKATELDGEPTLSEKDKAGSLLADAEIYPSSAQL
jgi:dTDP-4-dehydrorhamnose 3,5-epimerase